METAPLEFVEAEMTMQPTNSDYTERSSPPTVCEDQKIVVKETVIKNEVRPSEVVDNVKSEQNDVASDSSISNISDECLDVTMKEEPPALEELKVNNKCVGEDGLKSSDCQGEMNIVLNINSVQYILKNKLTVEEKVLVKQKGRPTPDLQIDVTSASASRTYKRLFNKNIYEKYKWMCGCEVINKLFCFVCLLRQKETSPWVKNGVNDLKHIAERAKKHENSVGHIYACVSYNVLGVADIRDQLSSTYLVHKQKHNESVDKNRHILRRLIMCIKFCGTFELALRGHEEGSTSDNRGIYLGLIDFAAELDSVLAIHIKEAKLFWGTSLQNELLDAMFQVYRNEVTRQIHSANFIAIEADEITDSSNHQQFVVIFRYVLDGQICERFWSFIKPSGYTAQILSNVLLTELQTKLNISPDKLISQSYDGASIMSGKNDGVQSIIRRIFPNAYFVHCYAHQFDLIMERAAQCNREVKIFFANLQAFSSFFSHSPTRVYFLDEIVKRRLPRVIPPRWNFKNRMVNTLYEYKDSFKECLEKIMNGDRVDFKTLNEANSLLNSLNCQKFLYWLKIFHFIMPHVEVFFNQAQARGIDNTHIQTAIKYFEEKIIKVRNLTDNFMLEKEGEPTRKKLKLINAGNSRSAAAKAVCDTILTQIKDRFDFKGHLCAAKLFESKNFKNYRKAFPQNYFNATVASYSVLNSVKLKTELTVVYNRQDMCNVTSISSLLMFITNNNLKDVFSETYKLLDIICTTPMSPSESERCFSTLKRVKVFLRSTVVEDRLNALAVLSIEKSFIQRIPDFDNKVIEIFSNSNNRRMDFHYK